MNGLARNLDAVDRSNAERRCRVGGVALGVLLVVAAALHADPVAAQEVRLLPGDVAPRSSTPPFHARGSRSEIGPGGLMSDDLPQELEGQGAALGLDADESGGQRDYQWMGLVLGGVVGAVSGAAIGAATSPGTEYRTTYPDVRCKGTIFNALCTGSMDRVVREKIGSSNDDPIGGAVLGAVVGGAVGWLIGKATSRSDAIPDAQFVANGRTLAVRLSTPR